MINNNTNTKTDIDAYKLAHILNISHTTVYRWLEQGLPYYTIVKGTKEVKRFNIELVEDWVKRNKRRYDNGK